MDSSARFERLTRRGHDLRKIGKFQHAIVKYTEALAEAGSNDKAAAIALGNRSLAQLLAGNAEKAKMDGEASKARDPTYSMAQVRIDEACKALSVKPRADPARQAPDCCSITGALLAVLVGLLYSGVLVRMGVFQWIDDLDPAGRGLRWRGETPWLVPTPWAYSEGQIPQLEGKVIVVTGANSGLGYWTTRHLAHRGATVILGCRSAAKCAAAAADACPEATSDCAGRTVPMPLDLTDVNSVVSFASAVQRAHTRLDSLVLNAGIMLRPWAVSAAGLELHFATNHVGHHLLAKLLLPLLRRTAAGHGVATVSVHSSAAMYEVTYEGGIAPQYLRRHAITKGKQATVPTWHSPMEAYSQSKLANVLFAQELAAREKAAGHNVLVNAHAPGAVKTHLLDHIIGPGGQLEQSAGPYVRAAVEHLLERILWHPRQASLTQVYTSVADGITAHGVTGKYFQSVAREQLPDPHCRNHTLQQMLWESTERLVAGVGVDEVE